MFLQTFNRIREFRKPVRSLVLFSFVYSLSGSIIGAFLQIALFEKFSDLTLNIIFTMANFTGVMVAFTVFGYALGYFRLNAKYGFYACIGLIAVSLPAIGYATTPTIAFLAMFVEGIGVGLFHLTNHTYELTETKDEERDFYSSVLSSGHRLIGLIGPLCATGLFFVSKNIFHLNSFTLLFLVAPCILLLGFFCFGGISDYSPSRMYWADVVHFFTDKRNLIAQMYISGSGAKDMLGTMIPPLVIFTILQSEIKVGLYNTALALFSVGVVLFVGHKRTSGNRLTIFGISAAIVSLSLIYLGYAFNLQALIIFSVVAAVLVPLMGVSDHVIALQTMESIGRKDQDFYATLVLRDFSLWFWRMIAAFVLLFLIRTIPSQTQALSIGLYLMAALIFFSFVGAAIFLASHKKVVV